MGGDIEKGRSLRSPERGLKFIEQLDILYKECRSVRRSVD
ncbi:hypothetical protein COPEUT_02656 [Coprococcus eutactus ATCC 27759]|nr:hypothetical protein COPEUT_02656 [Coprococcus eutactus ATCC 27759]